MLFVSPLAFDFYTRLEVETTIPFIHSSPAYLKFLPLTTNFIIPKINLCITTSLLSSTLISIYYHSHLQQTEYNNKNCKVSSCKNLHPQLVPRPFTSFYPSILPYSFHPPHNHTIVSGNDDNIVLNLEKV